LRSGTSAKQGDMAYAAGGSMMRLAARPGQGSAVQEALISVVACSSVPTGITCFALILWGLGIEPVKPEVPRA